MNSRWVFPKAMEVHAAKICVYFAALLDGPYLQKLVLGLKPTADDLAAYRLMIDSIKKNIRRIIIFE